MFSRMTVIDEASARALFAPLQPALAAAEANEAVDGAIDLDCLCSGTLRLHDGDLELDELHLRAGEPSLFVRGNLTVRGLIQQDFGAGFLVVFGDIDARDIASTAMIFAAGDLTVGGTLFGNSTNFMTIVLGQTRATTVVSAKEHYFCLYGARSLRHVVDVYGDTPNLDDRTHDSQHLIDGIDQGFDEVAVAAVLRAGGSLLRA